jgi:hypothetical protein
MFVRSSLHRGRKSRRDASGTFPGATLIFRRAFILSGYRMLQVNPEHEACRPSVFLRFGYIEVVGAGRDASGTYSLDLPQLPRLNSCMPRLIFYIADLRLQLLPLGYQLLNIGARI